MMGGVVGVGPAGEVLVGGRKRRWVGAGGQVGVVEGGLDGGEGGGRVSGRA